MRALALALALVLLATPAGAATFLDWAHCRLYPSHERCHPPALAAPIHAPVVAPPPAPAVVAPAPVATPQPPPVAAPVVVSAPPVAGPTRRHAPPRAKPRARTAVPTKPKRKHSASLPSWCARIPKGTTMGQIEFAAPMYGVKMTEKNRAQARACLASK